jgi:hypothetical protein
MNEKCMLNSNHNSNCYTQQQYKINETTKNGSIMSCTSIGPLLLCAFTLATSSGVPPPLVVSFFGEIVLQRQQQATVRTSVRKVLRFLAHVHGPNRALFFPTLWLARSIMATLLLLTYNMPIESFWQDKQLWGVRVQPSVRERPCVPSMPSNFCHVGACIGITTDVLVIAKLPVPTSTVN